MMVAVVRRGVAIVITGHIGLSQTVASARSVGRGLSASLVVEGAMLFWTHWIGVEEGVFSFFFFRISSMGRSVMLEDD